MRWKHIINNTMQGMYWLISNISKSLYDLKVIWSTQFILWSPVHHSKYFESISLDNTPNSQMGKTRLCEFRSLLKLNGKGTRTPCDHTEGKKDWTYFPPAHLLKGDTEGGVSAPKKRGEGHGGLLENTQTAGPLGKDASDTDQEKNLISRKWCAARP